MRYSLLAEYILFQRKDEIVMNFSKFNLNEQDIQSTIAFALYKDRKTIGMSWAKDKELMSVHDTIQVIGRAILEAVASGSGKNESYVERRDEVHKLIRMFADELNADPSQAIWRKAADEKPEGCHPKKVIFTLKEELFPKRRIFEGEFDYLSGKTFISNGVRYSIPEVAYWAYAPEPPIENED